MFPFFRHDGPIFKDQEEIVEYFFDNRCEDEHLYVVAKTHKEWWLVISDKYARLSYIYLFEGFDEARKASWYIEKLKALKIISGLTNRSE